MDGIVIKQANTVSGDRIVWIFTEERGIIKASGRGALKSRGRTGAGSQLFTYAEFELYDGKNMYSINSARPIDNFSRLEGNIIKLTLASYFCEAVYRHIGMNTPDIPVYRLLLNSIYALSYTDIDDELVKTVFEARLVSEIGYMPNLTCCGECGECDTEYCFSNKNGSLMCKSCADRRDLHITRSAVAAWRYIISAPIKKIFSFSADKNCINSLSAAVESYFLYHTDVLLNSFSYYNSLRRTNNGQT